MLYCEVIALLYACIIRITTKLRSITIAHGVVHNSDNALQTHIRGGGFTSNGQIEGKTRKVNKPRLLAALSHAPQQKMF